MQAVEDLLARDLGGQQPHRRVRDLVGRIVPGPGRTRARRGSDLRSATPSPVSAEIMNIALNGSALVAFGAPAPAGAPCLTRSILFRTRTSGGRCASASLLQNALHLLVDTLGRIDQQDDDVGIAGTAPGRLHHGPVEAAARARRCRAYR